jgi:serine phosphatase RsbU (regulator of sigma subunit)
MVHDSLIYPVSDSTEAIIQRTIEGIQKLINPQHDNDITPEEKEKTAAAAAIQINPAMNKHWESEIKTLQEAPRDAYKLREILKAKQKEYEKAEDSEDIESLVSEIEMLQFVLCLVSRKI